MRKKKVIMKDNKTLFVKINKFGWMITAIFISDETLECIECKNFKVIEASETSPYKIDDVIMLSKSELKYYRTYLK